MPWSRSFLLRGAAAALIAVGLLFAKGDDPAQGPLRVERRDFERILIFTGELEAIQSVSVTPPNVSGRWNFVVSFMAPEGSVVGPGDLLAQFDSSDLELERLDLEKKREEARIQIAQKQAETQIRRQDLLIQEAEAEKNLAVAQLYGALDPQLISAAQAEEYKYKLDNAQVELQKARQRLAGLEESSAADLAVLQLDFNRADLDLKRILADLQRMSIRAQTPGLVIYGSNWDGRKFQVGDTLQKRQELLSIPDLSKVRVRARVFDVDVPLLRNGAKARVILDAAPDRSFPARITRLSEVAKPVRYRSQLNVFHVDFVLDELDPEIMRPGMTARVLVPVMTAGALVVPRPAVFLDEEGRSFVNPAAPGSTPVEVRILNANDRWVHVEGELSEGLVLKVNAPSTGLPQSATDEAIEVKREDLRFTISGTGVLAASQAIAIRPPPIPRTWRFKIVSMAPEGSSVKEGDELVRFDPSEQMNRLREEKANLDKIVQEHEKTRASLELQTRNLELELEDSRVQAEKAANKLGQARLFDSHLKIREAEFEARLAEKRVAALQTKLESTQESSGWQLKVLQDSRKLHESRIAAAEAAIESLVVRAPAPGVVIYEANWNNQKHRVGGDVHMMNTVLSLPDLNSLLVEGQVAEVDAGRVEVGQSVILNIDAIPDKTFSGKIVELSNIFRQPSMERPVKVLDIVVALDEIDPRRMRPEMICRLQVVIDRFDDVLAIPLSVIGVDEEGSYVMVKSGDGARKQRIRLGRDNGVVAVVESGLHEGDQVISQALKTALPGAAP